MSDEDVSQPNANVVFETIGDLYHRRFHRLRPGKDSPAEFHEDSSSDENRERFGTWLQKQAFGDAITRIVRLTAENERLQALGEELSDLLAEARNERDMFKQQRADWKAAYDGLLEGVEHEDQEALRRG